MSIEINKHRNQWDNKIEDNFGTIMPIMIYRVVWKDENLRYCEFWTESEKLAINKKSQIDHSDGKLSYVNFEGWFAYRAMEHDAKFGRKGRDLHWWEPR